MSENAQASDKKSLNVLNTKFGAGRLVGIGPAVLLGAQFTILYGGDLSNMPSIIQYLFLASTFTNALAVYSLTSSPVYASVEGETDELTKVYADRANIAAVVLFTLSLSVDLGIASLKVIDNVPAAISITVAALAASGLIFLAQPFAKKKN